MKNIYISEMVQAQVKRELFNRNSQVIFPWKLQGEVPGGSQWFPAPSELRRVAWNRHQEVALRLEQQLTPGDHMYRCHFPTPAPQKARPLILSSEKKGRKKFGGPVPASTTGFCTFRTKGREGDAFKPSPYVTSKWHQLTCECCSFEKDILRAALCFLRQINSNINPLHSCPINSKIPGMRKL